MPNGREGGASREKIDAAAGTWREDSATEDANLAAMTASEMAKEEREWHSQSRFLMRASFNLLHQTARGYKKSNGCIFLMVALGVVRWLFDLAGALPEGERACVDELG